ncbi:MAG: hypothetical protein QM729_05070 [Solirubrobacterales bacterium]
MRLRGIATLVAASTLLAGVGVARATTGALELVHPPHVTVPYTRAARFPGRYVIQKVGEGAGIRSGEMKIAFSEGVVPEYLIGVAQFYEYNEAGQIETGLFTLFPFRESERGVTATVVNKGLLGAGSRHSVGELSLFKPTDEKTLEGQIELRGGGPYPVIFRRLAKGEKDPGGNPPVAGQIGEGGAGAAAREPAPPGWGAEPTEYEGEYELADPAADPSGEAGFLGPAVSAGRFVGQARGATGGSMSISGGKEPVAEVTIEAGSFSQTFYLTGLSYQGNSRKATVHAESVDSPTVGSFEGTQSGDLIKGTLEANGTSYEVSFEREGGDG